MVNTTSTRELYRQYKASLQKIADIKYSAAVLEWDQETYMPIKSAPTRAQQIATLSEMAHSLFTNEKTGDLLQELNQRNDLEENEKINVELSLYDYSKWKKLPAAFVRTLRETTSQGYQSWLEARKANSFSFFEKDLDLIIQLKKQEADMLGYEQHPYNALLNEYERGLTVEFLNKAFISLQQPLIDLLAKINNQPPVNDEFLRQYYNPKDQWQYGMELIRKLGFDFEAGRQDISEHPFTTNFSCRDVRVTTRINENDLANMTWSSIHEIGHALYEQGLPQEEYGLPLGEYASLSIHESQSRLWENNVGRSEGFWEYHGRSLKKWFPQQLNDVQNREFYKGINKVAPSLIRTEADELTYHFHVMIRYEIEKLLLEGLLKTKDVPGYWNEQYQKYLGIKVPDDKRGCLQDVHWSHGSFGYFPTYSLGSLYAAQFFTAAQKQIPLLEQNITNGITETLLEWLRITIHRYGRRFTGAELCTHITGEVLDIRYFLDYGNKKYGDIYNFH
ncbi:MAG: carboxypeptidase M32 [Chitinophagaceae bacterium]